MVKLRPWPKRAQNCFKFHIIHRNRNFKYINIWKEKAKLLTLKFFVMDILGIDFFHVCQLWTVNLYNYIWQHSRVHVGLWAFHLEDEQVLVDSPVIRWPPSHVYFRTVPTRKRLFCAGSIDLLTLPFVNVPGFLPSLQIGFPWV